MSKFYDFLKSAEVAVKRKLAASSLYEFQAPVELRGSSDIESALAKRNISLEANKSNSALPLPYKRELYERLCRGNTRENDTVNNEVLKKGRDAGRSDTTLLQASESSKSFKDILGYFESSCSRVVRQNYNTNDLQRPWHINPPKIKQIEPIVETSTFCGHCAQQNSNLKINENPVHLHTSVPFKNETKNLATETEPITIDKIYNRGNSVNSIDGYEKTFDNIAIAELPLRNRPSKITIEPVLPEGRNSYGFNEDEHAAFLHEQGFGYAVADGKDKGDMEFFRSTGDMRSQNKDVVNVETPRANGRKHSSNLTTFKDIIEMPDKGILVGFCKATPGDGMIFLDSTQQMSAIPATDKDVSFKDLFPPMNENCKAPRRDNRTSGMIFLNRPKRETKPNIKVDNSSFKHCCASMKNSLEETRKCCQSSGMIFLDHIQRKHTPKINEDKMNFEHYCRCKKKKHEAVIAEKSFKSIRDICEQAKCSAFDRKEALRKSVTPVVENLNNMSSSFKQFACAVMDKYMPKNAVGVQKIDNNKENNEFICIQKEEKCSKDISQIFKETCSKRKRKTCQTMESKEHNDQQNKSSEPECKRRKSIFQEQCSQRCNTFKVPKIRNMNASSVRENKPCNQQPKTLPVQGSVPLIGFQTNNVQMEQSPDKSFHVVTEKACEVFGTKEQTSRTDYKSSRRKKVYEVTTPSREETNIKNTVESPCYRLSKMKNIKEMKTKGYSLSKKKTRPPKMTPVSLEGYTPYKEDDLSLINSPRTVAYSYRPRKPSVAGNKKVTEKRNLGTSHVIKGKNVDLIRRLLSLKTGIKPSLSLLNETVHSRGHPEGLWHNVKMDSMSKKVLQYMTARKC